MPTKHPYSGDSVPFFNGLLDAADTCPVELHDWFQECIDETKWDLEVSSEAALSICEENMDVVDLFEGLCWEGANNSAPAWCTAGVDTFSEGYLPSCSKAFRPQVGPRRALSGRSPGRIIEA